MLAENTQPFTILRDVLYSCRVMATISSIPIHLFSHKKGTILDFVLDRVDEVAKQRAVDQRLVIGWLSDVQTPCVVLNFKKNRHIHDLRSIISKGLAKLYCIQHNVTFADIDPALKLYEEVVMLGLIPWNVHPHVVSHRHNLAKQVLCKCPICQQDNCSPSSHLYQYPLRGVFRWDLFAKLSLFLPDLEPQLGQSMPTPWSVWM